MEVLCGRKWNVQTKRLQGWKTLEHEESKDVQESYHALPALLALVTKLMNETMLTIGAEKGSERSLI